MGFAPKTVVVFFDVRDVKAGGFFLVERAESHGRSSPVLESHVLAHQRLQVNKFADFRDDGRMGIVDYATEQRLRVGAQPAADRRATVPIHPVPVGLEQLCPIAVFHKTLVAAIEVVEPEN